MSGSGFKDYFSGHANIYAAARPGYPDELFAFLASVVSGHRLAWDCATGNGQAAVSLAKYFDKIVATDASASQIEKAVSDPKIEYRVTKASDSGLSESSVDLITVATALHWFDFNSFFAEAARVLRKGGVLAAWAYFNPAITEEIDAVLRTYHQDVLNDYWAPEVKEHIMQRYRNVPFPYPLISTPQFTITRHWKLDQLCAHILSWSATQKYREAGHPDPLVPVLPALAEAWGNPQAERLITWDLFLKAGRKPL
jgi:SAM-dependent methyltransferase